MNKFSITSLLLFTFFLTACSNSQNMASFSPKKNSTDTSLVYIYRPGEMANAIYSPALTIDGEFKFYVKNGNNMQLSLSPGNHVFGFQDDSNFSELKSLSLILKPATRYFIRVDTSLKTNNASTYQPYERKFKLMSVIETQAVKEISACCVVSNKKSTTKEKAKSASSKPTDGFSVDKTQNPFSH